jgi:hypothetical protein
MASPDQKAMMLMSVSNEKTLDAAAQGVVQQYKLRVLDQRNVQINGMQAIVQIADQMTAEQQQAAQQGQAMTPTNSNGMAKTNGGQTNGGQTNSGQKSGTKDAPTAPSGSGQGGQTTSTPNNQGNNQGNNAGNQQGQAAQVTRVQTVLIQYNGLIYRFHGVSSSVDFPNFERLFSNTMRGFNTLNDPAKINVKEDHIRLRTSMYDGTLTDVLRGFGVAESKYKEISILNGLALTDRVSSGTMLKVIGK